jgi:very-short-patch-repair endonuclease
MPSPRAGFPARAMQDSPPSPEGRVDARSADGWGRPASDISTNVARALRKRLTPQEVRLWLPLRSLRAAGFHFRRQVPISTFVVDFACLKQKLVVEVDGASHAKHREARRDQHRDRKLHDLGYQVLRFWNSDIKADIETVIETILSKTRQTPPASHLFASAEPKTASHFSGRCECSAPSPDGREG